MSNPVSYAQKRKAGLVEHSGHVYKRQHDLIQFVMGNPTPIVFALDYEVRGQYMIIDASKLQPSHLGAVQNPYHFIPEAQPRNRATSASGALTPERIAQNLRPDEIMLGLSAYTGAPVVNARGEVIQGNGRAYALKTYWQQFPSDPKGYKRAIEDNNYKFGFLLLDAALKKQGITQPVLVRMVDVADKEAIQLGQFTQADTEAVATSTTRLKSKARLLTGPVLKRVLSELSLNDSDDKSLAELIRSSNVLKVLISEKVIRVDDLENYTRNGVINEAGVDFVSSLLLNAVFRSGDVNTADVLAMLPVASQNALKKSTIYLLKATGHKSINKEVSRAIIGYREFLASFQPSFRSWSNQFDLQGKTPADTYGALEMAIIDLLQRSTTQKEIVSKFRQYAALVNANPGNMFEAATKGQTKRVATAQVFGAKIALDRSLVNKDRAASQVLRKRVNRLVTKRRSSVKIPSPSIAEPATSPSINTSMTTQEKANFAERMAAARAAKREGKPAKKAKKATAVKKGPKAARKTRAAVGAKKATGTKKAGATKKATGTKKTTGTKKAGSKTGATVRKKATGLKTKRKARTTTAKKKNATVRLSSASARSRKSFIQEVGELSDKIHKRSFTGEYDQVPRYRISRKEADKKAIESVSRSRSKDAKNVRNIRLKV